MKKIYLLASCMLVGGVAFGQRSAPKAPVYDFSATPRVQTKGDVSFNDPAVADALQKGGAIWTEDFANGMNSTNGTWTQGGIDQIWKHSFYTTSGEWSNGTPAFAGASAANGFMLFDADSVNFLVSPNYVDKSGELISPSIDLSSESAVSLTFESNLRFCCSASLNLWASVSNDGGQTWTDYDVLNGLAVNAASPNPDLVNVNISAVAANQGNVQIKFSFGGGGVSHYYWIVDEINLVAPAGDDVTLTSVQYDDYIQYTYQPMNQVVPLDFWGFVDNQGANAQTNVTMDVSVDGVSNAFTGSGTIANLASTAIDSINASTMFTPSATDNYTITYDITMDNTDINPADNSMTQAFSVTDTVYGVDDGAPGGGLWNQDDGAGNTNSFEMGPFYEINANDYITSLTIFIGANTAPGAILYGVVYMDDASGFLYMDQTADYTVTAGDIGGSVTLPLSSPIAVAPGEGYVAAGGHYGGPDAMYIANGGTAPAQTCFFLDGTDNTWYYITSIPTVRMNMTPNVGLSEEASLAGVKLGQNYPNPTNGTTTISYELAQAGNVTLEVFDVTGKKVMEMNEGSQAAGQHNFVLDANSLSSGLYNYSLIVDGNRVTKTMLVE